MNITSLLYSASDLILVLNPTGFVNLFAVNNITTQQLDEMDSGQPFSNSRWFLHDLSLLIRFVLQNSLIQLPHDNRLFLYASVLIHNLCFFLAFILKDRYYTNSWAHPDLFNAGRMLQCGTNIILFGRMNIQIYLLPQIINE